MLDPNEACDGANLNGKTCMDLGFADAGMLKCDPSCAMFDVSGCMSSCGNGTAEPGETCDGADVLGKTCMDVGFADAGMLACAGDCKSFDMAGCMASCGNGKSEPGEACDGADLGGHDCTTFGFTNPMGLSCKGDCTTDSSTCTPTCDGTKLEPGEVCDGALLNGADCTTLGYQNPMGLVCTACKLDGAACMAMCGNNALEPGEACDGNLLGPKTCTDYGFVEPSGLACSMCTADTSGCVAACGNNVKEPGEECDGSSADPEKVCSPQCTLVYAAKINEALFDPPGSDGNGGEFIEIKAPAGMSLAGYALHFYTKAGVEYTAKLALDNNSVGMNGYFVVHVAAGVVVANGATELVSSKADLQNGPNSLQLVKTVNNVTTVIDALAYGTFAPADTFLGEGTAATTQANNAKSLSRLPDGKDTNNNSVDFAYSTATPGSANQ
jgi:hypothetical protein